MSGNKSQRTKGNAKPSSSSRASEFLQQGSQTGFIGFSGLAGNSYGYVPQVKVDDSELDGDLRMLLRKMTKRDTVTKLKAIQEFTTLCKDTDAQNITSIIPFWPRIYNKLSNDFDHRVREAVQQAHHQITTKAGRNLAPHLKHLIVNWLMSQFDVYTPVASAAKLSFDEVFPDKKKKEVLLFCKTDITEALHQNLLQETQDTLSDPKTVPVEEREARYIRFISGSFLLMKYIFEMISENLTKNANDDLENLFKEKKFWKFVKHKASLIRSSFYAMITSCCEHTPMYLEGNLALLSPAVLTFLDEQEPVVVKPMWNAVLLCLATYPAMWDSVNHRKAVFPKFWNLLKNAGFGNINLVYPNILPFLSKIPAKVFSDGIWFYEELFSNLTTGLFTKQDVLSASDLDVMLSAYLECMQYILSYSDQNKEILTDYLLENQLISLLRNTFDTTGDRRVWFGIFYTKFKKLVSWLCEQAEISDDAYFMKTHSKVWEMVIPILIANTDGTVSFKNDTANFFDSLIDFLFCFCKQTELQDKQSLISVNKDIDTLYQGRLFSLLQMVYVSYIHIIMEKHRTELSEQYVDLLSITLNINLWRETAQSLHQSNPTATKDVCMEFSQNVVQPMFAHKPCCNKLTRLMVGSSQLLSGQNIGEYLRFVFEMNSEDTVRLLLLSEVFKYQHTDSIQEWLASGFVQNMVISSCSTQTHGSMEQLKILQFQLLQAYIPIIHGKSSAFNLYIQSLLTITKNYLEGDRRDHDLERVVMQCVIAITKYSFEKGTSEDVDVKNQTLDDCFIDVSIGLLKSKLNNDDATSRAAMKSIVSCLAKQPEILQSFNSRLLSVVTEECTQYEGLYDAFANYLVTLNKHSESIAIKLFEDFCEKMTTTLSTKMDNSFEVTSFCVKVLHHLQTEDEDFLQTLPTTSVSSLVLCCVDSSPNPSQQSENDIQKLLGEFLSQSSYFHKTLIESAGNRNDSTESLTSLLQIFRDNSLLSDDLLDICLTQETPQLYDIKKVTVFCAALNFVTDVSHIRALVETYINVLQNDADVKKDSKCFAMLLKLIVGTVSRWYTVCESPSGPVDLSVCIASILDDLIVWKEEHDQMLLFSCSLTEYPADVVMLNTELMALMEYFTRICAKCYRREHWDFVLCSMVSWLQTCEESLPSRNSRFDVAPFLCTIFQLYTTIATVLNSSSSESDVSSNLKFVEIIINESKGINNLDRFVDDLRTEWKELFLPTASKTVLNVLMNVLQKGNLHQENEAFLSAVCSCVRFIPTTILKEMVYPESCTSDKKRLKTLESFHEQCCQLLDGGQWFLKIAAYQLQAKYVSSYLDFAFHRKRLGDLIEELLCEEIVENVDDEPQRIFPSMLIETMEKSRNEIYTLLSNEQASIVTPLEELHYDSSKMSLLTYLLSWLLMLDVFKMAAAGRRAKYANYFHRNNYVNDLLTFLFCLQPVGFNANSANTDVTVSCVDLKELQRLAYHVLMTSMKDIPALIRFWFNNNTNRKDSSIVDRFVSSHISPTLLKNEFSTLEVSSKEFDNMFIKTRPVAREVVAVYTVDEISMELVVKLSANHPLSPLTVECGKRIGVSNQLWRQWMLQLNTFLSFQNGSIVDGLSLWKKNVDKRFEGVEECMVCFSVIHGSNYSLPSIACKTCKKKFHPVCLTEINVTFCCGKRVVSLKR